MATVIQPFASTAGTAYVANENSNNISVIDATTNTVTATIAVGNRPVEVAVTPDGSRVYVANFGDGTVSVIDAASKAVITTVAVGSEPISIAINPNGSKAYVANFASSNVSVIDTITNTVTASIAVGDPATPSDPSAILVSPDGTRAYVTNQNQGTVSVIDTSSNVVVATVAVGDRNSNPAALGIMPNGSKVYVALFDNAAVSVIATATNAVTTSISVGSFPSGIAVTPDGQRVYVTSQGGTVSVIDGGSNTVITTVGVGGQLIGIAASPDGTSVYAAKFSLNSVSAISVATNNVTTNIPVGQGPYGIAVSGLRQTVPPSISKSFGAASIPLNGTSSLSFTINNPNSTTTLNGISFTDTLPTGLVLATPSSLSGTCGGGTITAVDGTNSVSLSGASLSPNASCSFSVNVTGIAAGAQNNTTGAVSSTNGGTGNTASASITVVAAAQQSTSLAYVANENSNDVSVIDTATNTVISTVPVGGKPVAAAILPDRSKVYVANFGEGTVSVINTATNVATATITVGSNPIGVAITPNGLKAYVANFGSSNVSVINTATNAVTTSIPIGNPPPALGSAPSSVAITPDGTRAYVTNFNDSTVSVIDTGNDTVIATIGVGAEPIALAITQDGTTAYVANFGASSLSAISVANNTVRTISVGPSPAGVAVTPDGSAIYVTSNTANNVSVVTTATNTVTTTIAVGSTPVGAAITPDGAIVYIANSNSNTTSAITVATNTVAATIAVGRGPFGIATPRALPPTIIKSFGAASIPNNGTSSLSFTITNPNTTLQLTGIAFTDSLPTGLVVATPNGLTNTCAGGAVANAGASLVSLSGVTLAAGSSCNLSVNVTATSAGTKNNNVTATSTEGGAGNTSTATLIVPAVAPPSITKSFSPTSIPLNGNSTLSFSISNPNTNVALSGVAFTDSLPAGVMVATPANLTGSCGNGTITATAGSGTVSLSGGTLTVSPTAGSTCTFSVSVTGTTAGVKNNSVQVTSTEGGTGNTSNASLTVVAPPTISKGFGAASIPVGGTTSLTFNITNPNSTVSLSNIAFGDSLPTGLSTAPLGVIGSFCGGTVQTGKISGVFFVSLSGGTLPANGSCSFSINVTGVTSGHQVNTTGIISATESGNGATATASIDVLGPPSIVKSFTPSVIAPNTNSTLAFTINNPAANPGALTGVGFTDALPANIVVATPDGLSGGCGGGTITATAGSGTVSLSGASIAAGTSCTFSVNVTGPTGTYTNTTGPVSSANGGTGNTASANLSVATPPTISKAFSASNVALNGAVSIFFSISNPNPNMAISGISFTDSLPSAGRGLPAALMVASPNGLTTDCTGTITAVAGSSSISLSGATLPAGGSCSIVLNLRATNQVPAAGVAVNITSPISSNETGTGATSNAATVAVLLPPNLSKSFAAPSLSLNGTTTLTFAVSNGNTATALTDLAFTDIMPAGLAVASPNGMAGTCLAPSAGVLIPASVTATPGSHTISMALLRLAGTASCSFSISVTGTQTGNQVNTTGNITATFDDGSGDSIATTGNSATASINITAGTLPPSISKAFSPTAINVNATSVLNFTIINPASNTVSETGVAFTDVLPAGLTVPNGTSSACGGTLTISGNNTISLSGATIAANGNCTFSVTVTGVAAGQYMNITSTVTSSNGGTGNTAAASISVMAPPVLVKSFGASSIPINGTASLVFTITNPNSTGTLSNLAFSDILPSGLVIASPNSLGGSCFTNEGGVMNQGTVTAQAGGSSISLSGLGLVGSGSCSFSLLVTAVATGSQVNTTGNITGTFDNGAGTPVSITGNASTATITVVKADTTTTVTSSQNPSIAGQSVTFTAALLAGVINPTGSVTFLDGGNPIGTGTLNAGQATFTTSALAAGSHTITTSYGGDTNFNGGTGSLTGNPQVVNNPQLGIPAFGITKTHVSDFTRGQTGAVYTITISNAAAGPSSGTVNVTDTLPNTSPTLTPISISGTGWTCNLNILTCTRSDALQPGGSYPPITLVVDVPETIPANVTNMATVSGGGDPNSHTASDLTHIGPLLQINPNGGPNLQVTAGSSTSMDFTINSGPGLGAITFSCGGLPPGASCSFNPSSENQITATVTITVSASAGSAPTATGTFQITVNAISTSSGQSSTAVVNLTVLGP